MRIPHWWVISCFRISAREILSCGHRRQENTHETEKIGEEVRDEVIRRNEARKDKEAAVESRKKMKLRELILSAKVIKDKMKSKKFKLTGKDLLVLVRYKRMKGDQPMPKGVAALRTRWNDTKHRASPHCSPNNSDDEKRRTMKKRMTSMTRRGGRWAQLD